MSLPVLSDDQRRENLRRAAEARHARAVLREGLKSGEVSLESVLNSDSRAAARMPVRALLESLPGYGRAKAGKIMDEVGISATRRVAGLGPRQRDELLRRFGPRP